MDSHTEFLLSLERECSRRLRTLYSELRSRNATIRRQLAQATDAMHRGETLTGATCYSEIVALASSNTTTAKEIKVANAQLHAIRNELADNGFYKQII
jgi:hypothetical protein